jgi:hypothetical protein
MEVLAFHPDDLEAVLTASPVTWVLLYLILREVRGRSEED